MVSSLFAGLLAVASIASALPQATTTGGRSCARIGSGVKDGQYTVTCGADRPGGDLSNAQSASFEDCIVQCDALAGCIGFAYVGGSGAGNCYFKSSVADQVSASNVDIAFKPAASSSPSSAAVLVSTSAPVSSTLQIPITSASLRATPSSTAAASCSQVGSTFAGYNVQCSTDRAGGDLSSVQASSFSGCFPICDATPNCAGFSFVGGSGAGTCYLKSSITSPTANQGVDTAVKPVSSFSSSSAAPSTTPSSAGSSCSQIGDGVRTSGYTTECATDRASGDLSNAAASSFQACIPICDATAGCVGFSYVGGSNAGTCYLKSSLSTATSNSNIDTAVKSSAVSSSSSSSTISSTTLSPSSSLVPSTTSSRSSTTSSTSSLTSGGVQSTTSRSSTSTSAIIASTTSRSTTSTSIASTSSKASSTTSSGLPVITITVLPGVPVPTISIPGFPYTVTTISIGFPTITTPTLSIPTTMATSTRTTTSSVPAATTTVPASTPTTGLFCTRYVFGLPVVVLCSTLW